MDFLSCIYHIYVEWTFPKIHKMPKINLNYSPKGYNSG